MPIIPVGGEVWQRAICARSQLGMHCASCVARGGGGAIRARSRTGLGPSISAGLVRLQDGAGSEPVAEVIRSLGFSAGPAGTSGANDLSAAEGERCARLHSLWLSCPAPCPARHVHPPCRARWGGPRLWRPCPVCPDAAGAWAARDIIRAGWPDSSSSQGRIMSATGTLAAVATVWLLPFRSGWTPGLGAWHGPIMRCPNCILNRRPTALFHPRRRLEAGAKRKTASVAGAGMAGTQTWWTTKAAPDSRGRIAFAGRPILRGRASGFLQTA